MKGIIRKAAAIGIVASLALTGCSTERYAQGSGAGDTPALRLLGWSGTTWNLNFNPFSPAGLSPGAAFIFEPLIRDDRLHPGSVKPWLAEKWTFNADGTELTFTLRDGVTWSDGKPLTAEDVAYTWGLSLDGKVTWGMPFKKVVAKDSKTVVLTYAEPAYADLPNFSGRMILPKHIWEKQNPKTWTNPEPVGTGLATLDKFTPQQVTLKVRDDYWGGRTKGVKTMTISASTPDASNQKMKAREADWGAMGWPNGEEEYVKLDPAHNKYIFYPAATSDGLIFNVEKEPYNDPAVRRALRDSLDLKVAADLVKVGYDVPTKAGLSSLAFKDVLAEDQEQKADPEKAKKELADAGWSVKDGKLAKDGKEFDLKYDVYQPYPEWVTTAQVMADQWRKNLGLHVAVNQMAEVPFTEATSLGKFGMATGYPIRGQALYSITNFLGPKSYQPIGEKTSQNFGRYRSERLNELIRKLEKLPADAPADQQKALALEVQQLFTEDAPFIGTAVSGWKGVFNTKTWTGFPEKGKADYVPQAMVYADAILTVMNLERAPE